MLLPNPTPVSSPLTLIALKEGGGRKAELLEGGRNFFSPYKELILKLNPISRTNRVLKVLNSQFNYR
jgi:hypothetical protein